MITMTKKFKVLGGDDMITVVNPYRQGQWSIWKLTYEEASHLATDLGYMSRRETPETIGNLRSIEGAETGDAA